MIKSLRTTKKKKKTPFTHIRNETGAYYRPTTSKDKKILQITLHTYIWQLKWNGPIPYKTQTTVIHPYGIDHLNSNVTIKEIEFVI